MHERYISEAVSSASDPLRLRDEKRHGPSQQQHAVDALDSADQPLGGSTRSVRKADRGIGDGREVNGLWRCCCGSDHKRHNGFETDFYARKHKRPEDDGPRKRGTGNRQRVQFDIPPAAIKPSERAPDRDQAKAVKHPITIFARDRKPFDAFHSPSDVATAEWAR